MKIDVQVIEKNGIPEWAVVPYDKFQKLLSDAEMLYDIRDFDLAKSKLARGEDELIPLSVANAILDGQNPIRVWREYRKIGSHSFAEAVGISTDVLAQIEWGNMMANKQVLSKMAQLLHVDIDDLA